MTTRSVPEETRTLQFKATDPRATAWVSANAGSGKTHVLAQRVIRLLLAGVLPSKLLCLTFTKAAAANMSLRIFDTLACWATFDDGELARAIAATGADVDPAQFAFARRLFARTIETPGGLKIQTIHAFCERILHLFPFEANVASRFRILDDQQKSDLIQTARRLILDRLSHADDPLHERLRALGVAFSSSTFETAIDKILGFRKELSAFAPASLEADNYEARLSRRLGLSSTETVADVERQILEGGLAPSDRPALVDALRQYGGVSDGKLADGLAADPTVEAYLKLFLTQAGGARPNLPTAAVKKARPDFALAIAREQERLPGLREKRLAARAVAHSVALLAIADAILQTYSDLKGQRSFLDFDDLIERTSNLLARSDAGWVLYKLDAGIDHILVDEAQDISPEQWNILAKLAQEFTSGLGQRQPTRTFFAVGDEKQSIFSFQGADPRMFDTMRRQFERSTKEANRPFQFVDLKMSFRSAPGILQFVDLVFTDENHRDGLSAENLQPVHEAWKHDLPAHVELWKPVDPAPLPAVKDWRMPLDAQTSEDPAVVLAKRIAALIASWLMPGAVETVHDAGSDRRRPIRASDIMILVRRRSAFFETMIRSLKEAGVPVAGADRLQLAQHLAIKDLLAIGHASLLPQDDLTLAVVLKSPLVGLDDDDLMVLAPNRAGSLAEAVADASDPRHQAAHQKLSAWREKAKALSPFDFYAELLGAEGGRRDITARFGPEASDALDEFLRLALAYERDQAPFLLHFLASFESTDLEVKRDMEAAGEAVRVMTVHAAKGLEAKIVFLPDTCTAPTGQHDPPVFRLDDNSGPLMIWSSKKDEEPSIVAAARADVRLNNQQEYRRLLYVALTRAEERLYVMGYRGRRVSKDLCWYDMIERSLASRVTPYPAFWNPEETIWRYGEDPAHPQQTTTRDEAGGNPLPPALPDWLFRMLPAEPDHPDRVRPSKTASRDDEPNDYSPSDRTAAFRYGETAHLLLRQLPDVPPADRAAFAQRLLAREDMADDVKHRLIGQVLAVLEQPALATLFGPASRAEVAIAGALSMAKATVDLDGRIDRLAVTATEIQIAEFKTDRRPSAAPRERYLLQLALYGAAMKTIYPQKTLNGFIVWTHGCVVEAVSEPELKKALARFETRRSIPAGRAEESVMENPLDDHADRET